MAVSRRDFLKLSGIAGGGGAIGGIAGLCASLAPAIARAQALRINELTALVGDPNVSIHEGKAFVCRVDKA